MYYCAETTKRVAKYPKDAPNGKAGQKYLWIKLDHRKYNKSKLDESVNYPESVIVDREGNLFIAERAGDEPIMLSSTRNFSITYNTATAIGTDSSRPHNFIYHGAVAHDKVLH